MDLLLLDDGRYHCPHCDYDTRACGQDGRALAQETRRTWTVAGDILITNGRSPDRRQPTATPRPKRLTRLRGHIMAAQGRLWSSIKINTGSLTTIVGVTDVDFPEFMNYVAESTGHDSSGGYYEAVATGKRVNLSPAT